MTIFIVATLSALRSPTFNLWLTPNRLSCPPCRRRLRFHTIQYYKYTILQYPKPHFSTLHCTAAVGMFIVADWWNIKKTITKRIKCAVLTVNQKLHTEISCEHSVKAYIYIIGPYQAYQPYLLRVIWLICNWEYTVFVQILLRWSPVVLLVLVTTRQAIHLVSTLKSVREELRIKPVWGPEKLEQLWVVASIACSSILA